MIVNLTKGEVKFMFPQRVRELRLEKHITQSELAKFANVTQQTVGAWERGKASPGADIITKLSNFFNVSTDYLLGQTDNKYKHSTEDEKDLKEFLDQNLEAGMRYDDQEITEEDKERLKIALTQIFWKHHNDL